MKKIKKRKMLSIFVELKDSMLLFLVLVSMVISLVGCGSAKIEHSEDSEVWMEVDTVNSALLGYVRGADEVVVDTLTYYGPALEIYPKQAYSIDTTDGSTVYLFIYSQGHLLYYDEALTCTVDEHGLKPAALFSIENKEDSVVGCMWYDQLVAASDGFPFDEPDENRFGIHYDRFSKRLYIPIMAPHDPDSEFANTSCMLYTGRFDVLQFNGREFVLAGEDGAWWLNPDMRNYKRTVSNRITTDGIEQIDLMPDGTYRRAVWKGAKTLDDLRRKPHITGKRAFIGRPNCHQELIVFERIKMNIEKIGISLGFLKTFSDICKQNLVAYDRFR